MTDGPLRRALKRLALWNFQLSLALHRRQIRRSKQDHYLLGGDCRLCARCCEAPSIQVGTLVWFLPPLRALFLAWQKHVNGFDLTDKDPEQQVFVFRCRHFDWTTRRCDSYESRPGMCRDYPRLLLEQPRPDFLPGCGYRAVYRKADALTRALQDAGVPADKLQKMRRELFLDDEAGEKPSK